MFECVENYGKAQLSLSKFYASMVEVKNSYQFGIDVLEHGALPELNEALEIFLLSWL